MASTMVWSASFVSLLWEIMRFFFSIIRMGWECMHISCCWRRQSYKTHGQGVHVGQRLEVVGVGVEVGEKTWV